MGALTPAAAGVLADAVLVLHVGVVAFVVLGLVAIPIGARLGWRWVRDARWRVVHVLLMLFIALQAWLGALCPLTIWEQALRRHAGEASYGATGKGDAQTYQVSAAAGTGFGGGRGHFARYGYRLSKRLSN